VSYAKIGNVQVEQGNLAGALKSYRDSLAIRERLGVLAWRVSISMEADFCIEALEEALAKHGKPEIFNTDQGGQFTSAEFTGVLLKNGIAISMDGKGSWRDNVFVERLWRSVKYEEVYLRAYDIVSEARTSIGRYLEFYNSGRPHSSLDRQTPDQAYFNRPPHAAAA
jgi:putative transposase